MARLLQDVRYALRTFAMAPGFTAIAVGVLALGIGANSAVFSLVNALLFHPLSGRAGELAGLYSHDRTKPDAYRPFSYPNYTDVRDRSSVFDSLMAHTFATVAVPAGDTMRRTFISVVSSNYFDTLGVALAAGRPFTAGEERPGAAIPVVIAGYGAWRAAGFAPSFLGSTLRINTQDFTVVGVTPDGFTGTMAVAAPELWLPLGMFDAIVKDVYRNNGRGLLDRSNAALLVAGRVTPGVDGRVVRERLDLLSAELERAYPAENRNQILSTATLPRMTNSSRPQTDAEIVSIAALVLGLCGVVLLIACLNIANMMLARGAARRREIAVRLAIGANRWRVVRQLLTEGLLLALAGAAAGLVVSYWASRAFAASLLSVLPLALTLDPRPDVNVLAATGGFAVAATMLFALGPALRLSRRNLGTDLKEDTIDRGAIGWFTARNALVVGQIALSLTLLTAGGLFARATLNASASDPGFRYDGALLATIDGSFADFDEARGRAMYRGVLERVRRLAGVAAAAPASTVPFGDTHESRIVEAVGFNPPAGRPPTYRVIGAGYFNALGLTMMRGREFTAEEEDSAEPPPVAIIDEVLARQLFGGRDPIGESIRFGEREASPGERAAAMQVVGIAPAIREDVTERDMPAHIYVPSGRHFRATVHLHVRLQPGADAAGTLAAIRRDIRGVDPRLPVLALTTMRAFHEKSLALWVLKAGGTTFSILGLLALVLAVVGVYGVRSYVVSSRTREIGIRMALGADARSVRWLVLRQGLTLTITGLAIGMPLAITASFVLNSVMWGFTRFDAPVILGAPAVLAAAALLASYIPARRATRIEPVRALRAV